MHEPTYRQALGESWNLVWQHKRLWIFGLFAALWGQLGLLEFFSRIFFANSGATLWYNFFTSVSDHQWRFVKLPIEQWVTIIWFLILIFGVFITFVFVATVCQGALIHVAGKYFGRKRMPRDVHESWHEGVKHFWKVLAVNILRKLFLGLAGVGIAFGAMNALFASSTTDNILFVVLASLGILVGLVISFLTIYAAGYIVVEGYPLARSVREAWRLFTRHPLVSFEMAFILLLLNLLLGILSLVAFYILLLPSFLMWFIAILASSKIIFTIGVGLSLSLFIIFVLIVGSFFTVFNISVWTYLFMKMHREGVISHLLRWSHHHKE